MPLMRTFIAVELEKSTAGAITRFVNRVAKANPDSEIQWSDTSQLHMTLCFLGDIDLNQSHEIAKLTQAVAAEIDPIEVSFGGFGAFPNLENPRVFWVGAKEVDAVTDHLSEAAKLRQGQAAFCPQLTGLSDRLVTTFLDHRYMPDTKPFRPHVTIGRIAGKKSQRNLEVLPAEMGMAEAGFGNQWIQSLRVMTSERTRTGSSYHPIATVAL